MTTLTSSQIGLLNLCWRESGPSIEEMFNFSSSYGASQQTLRDDFLILLNELLVWPIRYIDPTTYMPTGCLITPKGEVHIKELMAENPTIVPRRDVSIGLLLEEKGRDDVMAHFPKLSEMPPDEIASLAETYLHWAQSPPTDRVRIPTNELFYAAAIGFAHIDDSRRYAKSVKGCFAALEDKGRFFEVAALTSRLASDQPKFERITFAIATDFLEKPYWDLTGKKIPLIDSQFNLQQFLKDLTNIAASTGMAYSFKIPEQNHLIGIANRIEDILGQAFENSSESLYIQVINLENIYEQLLDSIVERTHAMNDFESRSGFAWRINLTTQCCVLLEQFADLVSLPEQTRLQAYKDTLQIIRILHRVIAVPVWSVCHEWDSPGNRGGNWAFELIGLNGTRQRIELLNLFHKLEKYRNSLSSPPSATKEVSTNSIIDPNAMNVNLQYLAMAINRLDEIKADTSLLTTVALPAIEEKLGILLLLSLDNHHSLRQICLVISNTDSILSHMDESLNSYLSEIKAEVKAIMQFVSQSSQIKEPDRQSFTKELGEVLKLSSAAKIIATVPLIPGFLEYKKEINLVTDWNKWLDKLASLFKRRD